MAVYREGFYALEALKQAYKEQTGKLFIPQKDFIIKIEKGTKAWAFVSNLITSYGNKDKRYFKHYLSNKSILTGVRSTFTLIDEWAVSDERKTIKEATETYEIIYTPISKTSGNVQIIKLK